MRRRHFYALGVYIIMGHGKTSCCRQIDSGSGVGVLCTCFVRGSAEDGSPLSLITSQADSTGTALEVRRSDSVAAENKLQRGLDVGTMYRLDSESAAVDKADEMAMRLSRHLALWSPSCSRLATSNVRYYDPKDPYVDEEEEHPTEPKSRDKGTLPKKL